MMSRRERELERLERAKQRHAREDAAGKLSAKVPDLKTLSIQLSERKPNGVTGDNNYIRRVVVEGAPALFEIACSSPDCEGGGYELTREMLAALSSHQERFEGHHACRGRGRVVDCGQELHYVATATYTS